MDLLELIRYSKDDRPLPLHQWDIGRKLKVNQIGDLQVHEVHFSNKTTIKALPVKVKQEDDMMVVEVPNILLQQPYKILAHPVYNPSDYVDMITVYDYEFEVKEKKQPEDYEYSETEVLNYKKLISEAKEMVEDTLNIIKEAYVSNKQTTGDFDIEQEAIIEKTLEFDLKGEPVEIAFAPTSIAWCSLINTSVEVTGNKAVITLQIGGIGDTDSANVTGVCFYRLTKYDDEIISELLDEINGEVI